MLVNQDQQEVKRNCRCHDEGRPSGLSVVGLDETLEYLLTATGMSVFEFVAVTVPP